MNIGIAVISTFVFQQFVYCKWFLSSYHVLFITRQNSIYHNFKMVILFLRASAIQKRPSAIFSESSVSRLFVPQLFKAYSSDCDRGMYSALYNTFWILSPPIPQFIVFSSKNLYQMLWYLRKPATMESPNKTVDAFFDDFISAACFLWFTSQLSL